MSRLIDADEIRITPEYMHDICGVAMIRVEDIARILNDMPTIQPEPRWISCSKDLPKESGYYLVVNEYGYCDIIWFAHKDDYDIDKSEWRETESTILAWMPLPEFHQEVEECVTE